jgi:hypothetical protein
MIYESTVRRFEADLGRVVTKVITKFWSEFVFYVKRFSLQTNSRPTFTKAA